MEYKKYLKTNGDKKQGTGTVSIDDSWSARIPNNISDPITAFDPKGNEYLTTGEGGKILWTTDNDGNRKSTSVFTLHLSPYDPSL